MYKFISKYIVERAKPYVNTEGDIVANPFVDLLRELGYKSMEYMDEPLYDEETEYLVPIYTEHDDKIVCDFEVTPINGGN